MINSSEMSDWKTDVYFKLMFINKKGFMNTALLDALAGL
jgi:hypothetical protein